MQILQSIDQGELRPQVELQGGVSDGSEIDQDHAAMSFLQGDGCIYGDSGGSSSALGVQERGIAMTAGPEPFDVVRALAVQETDPVSARDAQPFPLP
jgi:hypothetical protein